MRRMEFCHVSDHRLANVSYMSEGGSYLYTGHKWGEINSALVQENVHVLHQVIQNRTSLTRGLGALHLREDARKQCAEQLLGQGGIPLTK